jgi:hypothetical protein
MARAMEVVGDRWSILILREAYYGVKRFDEFEYYIGIASNILSTRLKKLIDAGVMARVPLPEHAGRYEYVLTDWLAEPAGPQVVFRERAAGRPIEYPALRTSGGKPLRLEDVEIVAGAGAVPFNRKRFGGNAADRGVVDSNAPVSRRKRK